MDFLEARDQGLWNGIQSVRHPWLDDIAVAVTFFSHPLVLTVVVVLTLALLCRQRRHWTGALLAFAFVGGIGLLITVRSLVERERPQVYRNPLEEPATTPSFPSERAFLATIVYLMVPLVLGARLSSKWRERLVIAGGALAFAIGLSRIYIGVCFPTDVLAGWFGALAWVLTCQAIGEKWAAA
jgi:undecaprenyl-diphosphatase